MCGGGGGVRGGPIFRLPQSQLTDTRAACPSTDHNYNAKRLAGCVCVVGGGGGGEGGTNIPSAPVTVN